MKINKENLAYGLAGCVIIATLQTYFGLPMLLAMVASAALGIALPVVKFEEEEDNATDQGEE